MKRILLILGLLGLPMAVFSQGTVQFLNPASAPLTTNSTATPPPGQLPNQAGLTTGAGQYTIGLYVAPAGTTDPNAFSLNGPTIGNQSGLANGRFNGGSSFVISNNTGQTIAFQVRAWSTFAGATYELAAGSAFLNHYLGVSQIGSVAPATGVGQPVPSLFGTSPGQISGFVLTPALNVPEPSSIALGILGLGAIALFRRRK